MRRRIISLTLSLSLLFQYSGFAQGPHPANLSQYLNQMPRPIQDRFRPLHMRYFSYDPQNNDFDLLLDKGDEKGLKDDELREKTAQLLEYFKIGLALPNDKFWVNLRPDAPEEIVDPLLENTDVGRILLEADLQLKKDTAAWTSPQTKEGREYWDKLYKKAGELFETENITIPTVTRPWIVPNEVIIHYSENSAYLYKASLKVMLEEDYLKSSQLSAVSSQQYVFSDPRLKELNEYSTQLIKELIIPQLTKEVNTSRRYAQLRQVFYSLALAQWFKQKYGSSGSARASVNSYINLIDSGNIADFASIRPWDKQDYFRQYRQSFQNGEYNLKEPVNGASGQNIRSYTSGGVIGDTTGARIAVEANSPLIPKGIDVIDPNSGLLGEHDSSAYARPLAAEVLRKPESIREGRDWIIKNEYVFGGGYGYDIRINDAAGFAEAASKGFYVMGRTLGKKLREDDMSGNPKALITADQRGTSGALRLALAQGLLDEGIEVTTQVDNQAINTALSSEKGLAEDFDLAIQITGSHNPKQANGAKIMYKSLPFYAGQLDVSAKDKNNPDKYKNSLRYQIEEYGKFLEKNINNPQGKAVIGKLNVDANLIPKHIEALNKILPDIQNPQSVIADFRNGCGAQVFMGVAEAKGYRVIELPSADAELSKDIFDSKEPVLIALNTRPSALMDAGIWDPSKPEAFDGIRKLQQRIYNEPRFQGKKFAGVALDGDGDRSGAITEGAKDSLGELIMPERMLISFYRRMILDNIAGIKSLSRLGHTVKLALDVRSSGVVIDVLKELSKEFGIRVEGEFIAAGFPNHRAFVLEELETIARLLQDNQDSPELTDYDQEAIKKLMLSYTSAEASGHFFFNVLSPEQFLEKKIVVDDGITSFFMYLHLVSTMDKYELAGEENPDKTFAQADRLSSKRPVTDEVRLEKAPADVDKKQQLAEEIMRQFIKDNPELLLVSLEGFEQKVNEARNNPPKRQNANEDLLLVDGIRLKLKNGVWLLLRKSNTQPVIVFKAEAQSQDKKFELLRVLRLLSQAINKVKDSSLDFQGLEINKFTNEIEKLEGVIKERSPSAITSADDFMIEIDYLMRMLKISDYPRIAQTFKTSVDPAALVNGLSQKTGKSIENIIEILKNSKFFKVLAANYLVKNIVSLNKGEYKSKKIVVTVGDTGYKTEGVQDDIMGEPLSDYLSLMREEAGNTPFVFRDNMEQYVGRFLNKYYGGFQDVKPTKPDLSGTIDMAGNFLKDVELGKIRYVIISGIGANEMYSHQLAAVLNQYFRRAQRDLRWIVVNNPAHLDPDVIPPDAASDNTIIFEMSRSGSTKEIVDFFNATSARFKQRIVAANVGTLKRLAQDLAKDKDACVLIIDDTPGDIGGRQMNRKTLMVYVPLFIALACGLKSSDYARPKVGVYVSGLWGANEELAYKNKLVSPAVALAEFLLRHRASGRNKFSVLYDDSLGASAKELFQLVNEGANKNIAGGTNDNILIKYSLQQDAARYMAIFSSMADSQVALFILNTTSPDYNLHLEYINNLEQKGIPCAVISANISREGEAALTEDLRTMSRISALLQDMVVYFTFITNQDANSNPAVKFVREITAAIFDIIKGKKAGGIGEVGIGFDEVINKISQKQNMGEGEARKTINERGVKPEDDPQGLLNSHPALKEFKEAIAAVSKNLALSEKEVIALLLSATSKSVLQTDVGEAGGSKIPEIGEAFLRSGINDSLGVLSPDPKVPALEKQIVLKDSPGMKISVAAAKQGSFSIPSGDADIPQALADYFYKIYKQRGEDWQYTALSFMEGDANNTLLQAMATNITEEFAGLGIAVPLLPLPGVAHTGIEAVMSHPEEVFNIAIMYTNAYGPGLGTSLVEPGVTIDDATYVYGMSNVIRMALGGTPSIIVEVRNKKNLDSVKWILEAAIAKFKERISSSALEINPGGVDLTHIGRVTQTKLLGGGVNSLLGAKESIKRTAKIAERIIAKGDFLAGAVKINLAQEEVYLSRLMDAQVLPLPQRVMNFAASSYFEGYPREKAQDMLVNYLRLEERFAVETPDELKQFLSAIQPLWESNETMYSDE